jgi:hypothetical protein
MHKFITFTFIETEEKSSRQITSINVAQLIGFEIFIYEDGNLNIKFFTAYGGYNGKVYQSLPLFIKKCQPTEEIIKGMNQKILDFLKSSEFILDLDKVFEEVCKALTGEK